MAYEALYRRYRPGRFADVTGQTHVMTALRNAVANDRVGHAYLFSGPRGTGKTTSARILAKALNCLNQTDGEPCDECTSCENFRTGSSYDLRELDAASNNGVEAMRDLISKVGLSAGGHGVFILDEVHMLSTGAENALLKTLEEPPPNVTFILATTEPNKVVATIRSRTQHYDFTLLSAAELTTLVRSIAQDDGLSLTDHDVEWVVRAGAGSARDTLSALDQVVAAGGAPDDGDHTDALLGALATADTGAALVAVNQATQSGREPELIGRGLLADLRNAFLSVMGADLDHLSEADQAAAQRNAEQFGPATITRAMELIGTAVVNMRQAPDPRVDLELALVRLTRPALDVDLTALTARVEQLESGAPPSATVAAVSAPPLGAVLPAQEPEPVPPETDTQATGTPPTRSDHGAVSSDAPSMDEQAPPSAAVPPVADPSVPPPAEAATAPPLSPEAPPVTAAAPPAAPAPAAAPAVPPAGGQGGRMRPADVARQRLRESQQSRTPGGPAPASPSTGQAAPPAASPSQPQEQPTPDPVPGRARPTLGSLRRAEAADPGHTGIETAPVDDAGRSGTPASEPMAQPAPPHLHDEQPAQEPVAPPVEAPADAPVPSEQHAPDQNTPNGSASQLTPTMDPAGHQPAATEETVVAEQPAVTEQPPAAGQTAGSVPSLVAAQTAWHETILAGLPGRVKSRFSAGQFVDAPPGRLAFALPNAVHCARCEDVRDEVDAALAAHFGGPVPLDLVVGQEDFAAPDTRDDSSASEAEQHESIDLDSLTDANDVGATVVERLEQAFPGSKLMSQEGEGS